MDSITKEKNITDFPSKLPIKLSKRVHTGKTNIHLVSSTPMNPLKRAKFFDESNQLGSPIRSGSSSTDVNSKSPETNIKIVENKLITKPKMINNEEQTAGASPFPYFTKLSVKKMTICASDDDSDDNIFVKSSDKITKTNKELLDMPDELNSDTSEEYDTLIIESQTEAIVEPVKNVSFDNKIDVKTNKNVTKTKSSKSNDENKENVEVKTKTKQKNDKTNTNKIDKNTITSPKQKKSNVVPKPKIMRIESDNTETDSENGNNKVSTKSTKLTPPNKDTTRRKKIPESGIRKSARSCQSTIPFWVAPWNNCTNITQNDTHIIKRTKSEEISYAISTNDSKRPKTVPETSKKTKREKKLENTFVEPEPVQEKAKSKSPVGKRKINNETRDSTKTLNRSKTKINEDDNDDEVTSKQKRQIKKTDNDKIDELPDTTKTLNKSKTKTNEPDRNDKNIPNNENDGQVSKLKNQTKKKGNDEKDELPDTTKTLNKSKTKINEIHKSNDNENDERPDTTKTLNKSKTKINEPDIQTENTRETRSRIQAKKKENDEVADTTKTLNKKRNVLKSKDHEDNIEAVSIEQNNKTRTYTKELLDKENKEKKNKIDIKYKSKYTYSQSVLENDVFESEIEDDNVPTTSRKDTSIKSKNTSKHENLDVVSDQTFEVNSPLRASKRLRTKNKDAYRETNKIAYTPVVVLNRNLNDVKKTSKKNATNIENKTISETDNRTSAKNLNDSENNFQSDVSNSESRKGSAPSRLRKRTVEKTKPIKIRGNKTIIKTPRYIREKAYKNTVKSRNKQVNFNVNNNDFEVENSFESDSLSPNENPLKTYRKSSRNLFRESRPRYSRKSAFYQPDSTAGLYKSNLRKHKYMNNDSTLDDDSLSSEEFYLPEKKKRKYAFRNEYKRNTENLSVLHFKERALAAQVPVVTRTLTEIKHHGKSMMMECFGNFPNTMTKANENSALRGTCFMNNFFASGVMEIKLGKVKSCNGSNNHTYFIILDGIAEFGIANSTKIMRIGDCCIVPKHTFYYISNVSSEINLLINFLKISL